MRKKFYYGKGRFIYRERERARIVRDEDEKMWKIVLFVLYVEVVVCWIEYLCCMNKVHT